MTSGITTLSSDITYKLQCYLHGRKPYFKQRLGTSVNLQ